MVLTGIGLGEYPVPLITNHGARLAPEDAYAVQILVTANGTPAIAFCVDLFTGISLETYNAICGSPADYTNGLRAAWIVATYGPVVTANLDAAALQLALWDVVHVSGDGLSAGRVQMAPLHSHPKGSLPGNASTAQGTTAYVTSCPVHLGPCIGALYTTGNTSLSTYIANGLLYGERPPEPSTGMPVRPVVVTQRACLAATWAH